MQQPTSPDEAKSVKFAFPSGAAVFGADADLTETARLLNNFTELPPQTELTPPPKATVMIAPAPVEATPIMAKPENMATAPESVDEWPKDPMRIPCTHCGHFIETMTNEETGGQRFS